MARKRAAPGPTLGFRDQARSDGIRVDVTDGALKMLFVADVAVPILSCPDGLWRASRLTTLFGMPIWRSALPGVTSPIRRLAFPGVRLPIGGLACPGAVANSAGGEFLPGGNDGGYAPGVKGLEQGMHMIGHDHPGEEPVTLGVEKKKRSLDHSGNAGIAQDAGAMASVNPGVNAVSALGIAFLRGQEFQLLFKTPKG